MALKIEIEAAGPGRARLLVGGSRRAPESVVLAVQRNDGRYLGLDGQWQVTPHWHPQFSAEPAPDGLRMEAGPDLVDSIVAVGGSPLLITLRIDGVEAAGVLRMRGALIGSPARAPRQSGAPPAPTTDLGATGLVGDGVKQPTFGSDPGGSGEDTGMTSATPKGRTRWSWVVMGAITLSAVAGVAAWQFGLFGQTQPAESLDAVGTPIPAVLPPTPEPPPPPPLTGLELARGFLSARPELDAVYARAEQAEQAGDCTAAYALYSEAANGNAGLAARLARRYDPPTHTPSPCIVAPDTPYAIVYFTDAAEQGDIAVQRRLGQLMVEREASGPTREAGLRWLRKAAEAGDAEARRTLDGLGGR